MWYSLVLTVLIVLADSNVSLARVSFSPKLIKGVVGSDSIGIHFHTSSGASSLHLAGTVMLPQDTIGQEVSRSEVRRVPAEMKPVSAFNTTECLMLQKRFQIGNIYYTKNQSYIRNSELPVIENLIGLLSQNPDLQIVINSHADVTASEIYNLLLSGKRALVVKQFLISRGIAEDRIRTMYSGESSPLVNCPELRCTDWELQLNRRTEFYIVYKGRNITLGCY